jgi:hypothetical protein
MSWPMIFMNYITAQSQFMDDPNKHRFRPRFEVSQNQSYAKYC